MHWTIAHGDGPYQTTTATYNYGGMGGLRARCSTSTGNRNKMQLSIDGADISEVDVDGNSKTDQTCTVKGVDGKWYAPMPFKNISVGWESYQHDRVGAHDAWIDDVILDESPIACRRLE